MKTILQTLALVVCLCLTSTICQAQIPNGSVAPDWTVTDLDGNTHHLQSILNNGKTVIIDFSATWCGPCWNYHNTHALSDIHNLYGPNGTDEFFVIFLESDPSTNTQCLYNQAGCTGGTQGNWVQNTPYPIADLATSAIPSAYGINAYPTIVTICPDGLLFESGQASAFTHYTWKESCDFDASLVSTSGMQCYEEQSGTADIDVVGGYGGKTYKWSNGQTSQDLVGAYPGTYACTATEGNGRTKVITDVIVPGPSSELLATTEVVSHVTCNGEGNGRIEVNTAGGSPNYTYLWSNGSVTEDLINLGEGTYTLEVTDDNGCSKEVTESIIDPEAVSATIETTEENCGGEDATITVDGLGGTGALTYSYGPETNQTGIFKNVAAGPYTIEVTDVNDCLFTEPIEVEEIPAPFLQVSPAEELTCQTATVTLIALSEVGPSFNYVWSTSNGNIVSGANTLAAKVDAPGVYNIAVINLENGCLSQASVTVEGSADLPAIEIEPAANFTCTTTEIVIDASNSASGPDITYEWTTTNGTIVSGSSSDMLIVSTTGTYTLLVTNTASGCTNTSAIEVEGDPSVPVANVENPSAIDCDNQSITLDGSGSSQGQDYEYQWTTSDGVIISAVDDEAIVGAGGTYTLVVTNSINGCTNEFVVVVEDESVYVEALYAHKSSALTVELEDLTSGNPTDMSWDMGDGEIITGSLSSYVYEKEGTYKVCLVAANGCGEDQFCSYVTVTYKAKENQTANPSQTSTGAGGNSIVTLDGGQNSRVDVTVFPNPTSGLFSINLAERQLVNSYQLVDMDGRTILTQNVNGETSTIELDAAQISNGTYFIQIQLENGVVVKPVVVMK